MNRNRRTDDGTYPNVEEEREKADERVAAGVTVTDSSTTWTQGHLKVIMNTSTKDGKTERTVKAIDIRPLRTAVAPRNSLQWEGTFHEFLAYGSSVALLADVVKRQVEKDQIANAPHQIPHSDDGFDGGYGGAK